MKHMVIFQGVLIVGLILSACSPAVPGNSTESFLFTYIGADGNVWAHPGIGGQPKQVTTEATGSPDGDQPGQAISFLFPQISSDGEWIAYRRDIGVPGMAGEEYSSQLWSHNLKSGRSRLVLDQPVGSFVWKPGTHILTDAPAVPEQYFSGNPPDASLAVSVMGFDVDTGKSEKLVKPERGYALTAYQWSPDGRFLGFDELVYIEGRGPFGYYDFATGTYVAWDDHIGNYSWHPTEASIFYDRLSYVPTGTEDVFSCKLDEKGERHLTDYKAQFEYAFWPVVSPDGARIAYLAGLNGFESQTYTLLVQDLTGGEVTPLGKFEAVLNPSWSPDGSMLLFSAGPWNDQEVMAVSISDVLVTSLGRGTMVDVADEAE